MIAALALAALLQATAPAQPPAPPPPTPKPPAQPLTIDRPQTRTSGPALTVGSTTFAPDGPMALANSGYGKNHAPAVSWSAGPPATKSYVLIVEDADASLDGSRPLLHWLAYDIPPTASELKNRTRNLARVVPETGRRRRGAEPAFDPEASAQSAKEPFVTLSQGLNDHGGLGWTGPHPPVGDPAHHYHFQVFALDRKTVASPGAAYDRVLHDLGGHVLAKGQMIGLYAQAPEKVRKIKDKDGKLTEAAPAV